MTADERLALIRVKIERANKHLHELEVERDRFIQTKPYTIKSERDPQTGDERLKVFDTRTPPAVISLITGDVIHNLRSALDHLAWQLVLANGETPTKQTCFPIYDDAAKYKAGRGGQVKGMAQAAIDTIDAIEPYESGNDDIWLIHKLDIIDKHRTLLTALISVSSVEFQIPGSMLQIGLNNISIGGFALPNFSSPLKDGDVIFFRQPDMHHDPEFTFDVAFAEPGIIEGQPVLVSLRQLSNYLDALILSFEPLLS